MGAMLKKGRVAALAIQTVQNTLTIHKIRTSTATELVIAKMQNHRIALLQGN